MPKIKRFNNYSLVEALFVIFLVAILFNMALLFYYEGRKASIRYMNKAALIRSVSTIAENWRDFVHKNPAPVKVETNKIMFENKASATIQNNQLVFTMSKGQKTFAFPDSFAVSFDQENNQGEAPILVLYFKEKGNKGQVLKDKFIRIIASSKRGVK